MKWFVFWVIKYSLAAVVWYAIDDRIAAQFASPAVGSIPLFMLVGIVFFISLCSEQFSVVRAYEVGR